MNTLRRYVKNAKDVFRIIVGAIGSYVGVVSNILGAVMGILASEIGRASWRERV